MFLVRVLKAMMKTQETMMKIELILVSERNEKRIQ